MTSTASTPAATIRRAADLLLRRAEAATEGPWARDDGYITATGPGDEDPGGIPGRCEIVRVNAWPDGEYLRARSDDDLTYIASMDPAAGTGFARMLTQAANDAGRHLSFSGSAWLCEACGGALGEDCHLDTAHAAAQQYLKDH